MAKKLSKFSLHPPTDKPKEGMRIRLISMVDDPNPVSPGTEGTIRLVDDIGTIHVRWDDGRQLGVIPGVDQYQLLESNIKGVNPPKTTRLSSTTKSAIKSSGIKSNPNIKKIKVEGETDTSWDELVNDEVEDKIKGGKADKLSIKDLSKKHKVSVDEIKKEIRIGVKIEKEHVGDDINKAKEIAMDHISEFSDYYSNKRYGVLASEKGLKKSKKEKEEIDYMTSTGSVGGVNGMGYSSPAAWGPGVLTKKTGVAKSGPIKEMTTTFNTDRTEGTNPLGTNPWKDLDHDKWNFDDVPTWKGGKIIDPLAKIKGTWDNDNLDISKEWDKSQKKKSLKKEDFLRMVNNRLNESKESTKYYVTKNSGPGTKVVKGPVSKSQAEDFANKENEKILKQQETIRKGQVTSDAAKGVPLRKEKYKIFNVITDKELDNVGKGWWDEIEKEVKDVELDETTTFGSVWGSNGPPVGPAFAAKKGQWNMIKKPIWVGGTIVQKDIEESVLNPITEVNKVKYNPNGKIVTIKKKCTKFPYCSQGAIDNPLNLSNTTKGSGTYVEENFLTDETIKNIKEVADKTGKSFNEVYRTIIKSLS